MNIKKILVAGCWLLVVSSIVWAQFEAPDPSNNVPNSRVLGLGKAYIALADDTGAIFTNPAGLGKVESWQLTTMSGKLLEDFGYLSLAGFYPTDFGVFGIGFMGSSISGAYATIADPNSDPNDPIYIIDFSQPAMSYYNNVYVLSYGTKLSRFFKRFGWEDKLSLGANVKLFSAGLSGDGITAGEGDGSGMDLDFGVLSDTPWPWLTLGAALQNFLPHSLGGRLRYASGHEESYIAILELGSALKLLGRKGLFGRKLGDQELLYLMDFDLRPTLSNYPMVGHFGLEYKPFPLIAIRMGIDQDVEADQSGNLVTVANFTSGVGLNAGGFSFDYAYHQFAGISQISNNYFSLSYGVTPPKLIGKKLPQLEFAKNYDKTMTFPARISAAGRANDARIRYLQVGDKIVKIGLRGEFKTEVNLRIGKNAVVVKGFDAGKKKVYDGKLRILRLKEFPDVERVYWVAEPISLLAMRKIITGYPDGTFRPEGNITRAEMAALLMKTKALTPKSPLPEGEGTFRDVAARHWAAPYIARAAEEGIVKGYADGTFRPGANITRAEGLAMVARFAGISEEAYTGQFPDVVGAYWAAKIISGAYNAGILEYLKGKNFELKRLLTRAETVEMLYRTAVVKDLLAKDLLDWESY